MGLLTPRETIFLDSSTTTYYVARRLVETGHRGHRADQLPAGHGAAVHARAAPSLEVIGIGGTLRRLTRSFVGPFAVRTVQGHFADRLFLSVKGIAANGMLTDADPLEAELKRTMIEQAGESVLLIDHSKLSVRGLSVIAPIADVDDRAGDRARRRRGRRAAPRRHDGPDRLSGHCMRNYTGV